MARSQMVAILAKRANTLPRFALDAVYIEKLRERLRVTRLFEYMLYREARRVWSYVNAL